MSVKSVTDESDAISTNLAECK